MQTRSNLEHVLQNTCKDPDCEIHNIVVAGEELVINETNLAYWFAGAQYAEQHSTGAAAMELARALEAMRCTEAAMDRQCMIDAAAAEAEEEMANQRDEDMSTEGRNVDTD